MHHIMRMIVEAENEEKALAKAKMELHNIIESRQTFIDYGTFFDDEETSVYSARRRGKRKAVMKLDSKKGAFMLLEGLQIEYDEFKNAMREIRDSVKELSDEEIYKKDMLKWRFKSIDNHEWVTYQEQGIDAGNLARDLKDEDIDRLFIVPVNVHT